MPKSNDTLADFLNAQHASDLVSVLLELAADHEPVRKRLARMQLAEQPAKLAAGFRKTLSGWRRTKRFRDYREAREFGRMLEDWLDQVARELLPRDPVAALSLFEAFIEADAAWFDHADDSDGVIGNAVRAACAYWFQAAVNCPVPRDGWADRVLKLYDGDEYGGRESMLRRAGALLDEDAQRGLVTRLEARLDETLRQAAGATSLPYEVYRESGALSLLSESLRDPDIKVRATLRYSPRPNSLQQEDFAKSYLDSERPSDALHWLEEPWGDHEESRIALLAEALEMLGRFDESVPLRKQVFEATLHEEDYEHWVKHLPPSDRSRATADARKFALGHGHPVTAAQLLVHLGDPAGAESRLIADAARLDGNDYDGLVPLAKSMREHGRARGETAVYRALMNTILDRARTPAYGHAARYWVRLGAIAEDAADLAPLASHETFAADIRARHGRKTAFWGRVSEMTRDPDR